MFASLFIGLIGLVCAFLGWLIWKKEKISLLHDYHYNKVSEKNKKNFCTLSGLGLVFIGAGLLLTAVIFAFTESVLSFIAFAAGSFAGVGLLIYAGRKYNL